MVPFRKFKGNRVFSKRPVWWARNAIAFCSPLLCHEHLPKVTRVRTQVTIQVDVTLAQRHEERSKGNLLRERWKNSQQPVIRTPLRP